MVTLAPRVTADYPSEYGCETTVGQAWRSLRGVRSGATDSRMMGLRSYRSGIDDVPTPHAGVPRPFRSVSGVVPHPLGHNARSHRRNSERFQSLGTRRKTKAQQDTAAIPLVDPQARVQAFGRFQQMET